MTTQRELPQDIDAERAVLGSAIVQGNEAAEDLVLQLKEEDFYFAPHAIIFHAIASVQKKFGSLDLLSLIKEITEMGALEEIGGKDYLATVMMESQNITPLMAKRHIKTIIDCSNKRKVVAISNEASGRCYDNRESSSKIIDKAFSDLTMVSEKRDNSSLTELSDMMVDALMLVKKKITGAIERLPTGFYFLDKIIDGFHPGELIILAARAGIGKTTSAMTFANNICRENDVLFVSLEMSSMELAFRLLGSGGVFPNNAFRNCRFDDDELQKLLAMASKLSKGFLLCDDSPGRTITQIEAVARSRARKGKLKLLVIDYIGLIQSEDTRLPQHEQIAQMTRALKKLARELHIPVLCLAQLNRQAADQTGKVENRPQLHHLRSSGAIEQDADVVLFVHRPDMYDKDREESLEKGHLGVCELIVAKQRNGATGSVKLYFQGEHTRIVEGVYAYNESEWNNAIGKVSAVHYEPVEQTEDVVEWKPEPATAEPDPYENIDIGDFEEAPNEEERKREMIEREKKFMEEIDAGDFVEEDVAVSSVPNPAMEGFRRWLENG